MFKRFLPQFIIVLVLCIISTVGIVTEKSMQTSSQKILDRQTIIIDAGHGGFDGGAVAFDGTSEKDINLHISLCLANMLRVLGFDVVLTREVDTGTDSTDSQKIASRKKSDLKNRLALMEKYPNSYFLSVHLNKFTTTAANGAQVFYSKNFEESKDIALCVQKSIVSMLQPTNTRVIKQGTSATYLLHNANVPAIIVECGFLSNSSELLKLKDKDYQQQMAFAIFSGVVDYFNNKKD